MNSPVGSYSLGPSFLLLGFHPKMNGRIRVYEQPTDSPRDVVHRGQGGEGGCLPSDDRVPHPASLTCGIVQVPSRRDGGLSFGQYKRIMRMNVSFGAGSQFSSF